MATSHIVMMFLGGRLDHTTRGVVQSVVEPGRPAAPVYRTPETHEGPSEAYFATKIDIEGKPSWWVYILDGYAPPRSHILDTNPYPLAFS